MFVDIQLDASKVLEKFEQMQNNLVKLKTSELQNEMKSWQDENFQRKRPNVETASGEDHTEVSSKFWERSSEPIKRAQARTKPTRKVTLGKAMKRTQAKRRTDIMRPEVVLTLYVDMMKLVTRMFTWPR
jgi:hypothetical protein